MLNPIDTAAVIRDGRIAGRFPSDIHEGVAWWIGSCFVLVSRTSHIAVGYDQHPTSHTFFDRFCQGAINAEHHACRVSALGTSDASHLMRLSQELGGVPSALVTTAMDDEGQMVTITLYDRSGRQLDDDTGLTAIRTLIDEDRVPLPVNDRAKGTVEAVPEELRDGSP